TGGRYPSQQEHPLESLFVQFRPCAQSPAWGEVLLRALFVDACRLAVDPAKAERFLDRHVVVEASTTGRPRPHQPDACSRRVVAFQPSTPGVTVVRLDVRCAAEGALRRGHRAVPPANTSR